MKPTTRYSRANATRGSYTHIAVAEKALGKSLPPRAEVHHVDYDRFNNANTNLVVCPSHAYHKLLHVRTDALLACGNADFRVCVRCGKYDDPARMYLQAKTASYSHRSCNAEHQRKLRAEK